MMNSLTQQVRFAARYLALAPKVCSRSLTTTRGLFNEAAKDEVVRPAAETTKISDFYDQGIISKEVYNALTKMKFENFTAVQSKTIGPLTVGEKGIIARAKTGTGKTLAFGLPLIEKAIKRDPRSKAVIGLIISPTRDLAYQIRDELIKVVSSFPRETPHVNVHCLVGAEPKHQQIRAFTRPYTFPQIIVATPGRLFDMLENPLVQKSLATLEFKVLDEADRLLDDGFKDSLLEIENAIRDIKRENNGETEKTLLFSATIDKNVLSFAEDILGKDLNYIDCVDKDAPETHEKVEQSLIATENLFESYVASSLFIENESNSNKDFKTVVFLPTVKSVSYYKETLEQYLRSQNSRLPVFELHGKLTQSARDRSVRQFRERSRGVLVTSDVGARGMDFPGVSNVIQIGVPTDTTNYVHRIGRTARGGKSGSALLILTKAEGPFVKVLLRRKINIVKQYAYEKVEESEEAITKASLTAYHKFGADQVIESLLGFYNGVLSNYRMHINNVLTDITGAYTRLIDEPHRRPRISRAVWKNVLNLKPNEAAYYFDVSNSQAYADHGQPDFMNKKSFNNRSSFNNRGFDPTKSSRTFKNDRYRDPNSDSLVANDDGIPARGRPYHKEFRNKFPQGNDPRNRRRGAPQGRYDSRSSGGYESRSSNRYNSDNNSD